MPRCRVDQSIERVVMGGFEFPLGVYPIEDMKPIEGYTVAFESSDGGEGGGGMGGGGEQDDPDGDWEEWPDRYVWDIVLRSTRLEAFCRTLFAMLPGRVYPILDVLGSDAYRELDPYVSYELVGMERFLEGLRLFRGYFFEDGLVGFGAMSDEPFLYVFVDEHKIVTVRAESDLKEKVEKVLEAFDLQEVEQIAGADAAVHEHRGVLEAPADRPDLLIAEEIVEELKDLWGLGLNVDGEKNLDEVGNELGVTPWRCLVRAVVDKGIFKYAEVLLTADCLNSAHDLAEEAVGTHYADEREAAAETDPLTPSDEGESDGPELDVITADRLTREDFDKAVKEAGGRTLPGSDVSTSAIWAVRWVE